MGKGLESQKGFTHLLLVAIIAVVASLAVLANIPMTRQYASGHSQVAGVTSDPSQTKDVRIIHEGSQTAFTKGVSGAVSDYPISFDEKSGTVLVNTPLGVKSVSVLPDAAVKSALYSRVVDNIKSVNPSGALASINQLTKLESKDNVLGYSVKGDKEVKLLGVIPLKFGVTAFVSAENGQVVESQTSILSKLLGKVSS